MADSIKVRRAGGIAQVLLNRPETYNACHLEMAESLSRHLITLAVEDDVRGIVVAGEGKAFCVGGDVKWASGFPQGPAAAFHELAARFDQAIVELRRMPKPVIAAIDGIAAGGGFSLALACDFRIMSHSAILRQAYTSNGLCINGGGTFFLPRLVGLARALEIAAFDKPISSEQAMTWGLTTKVVEDGRALEEAMALAHELTKISLNSFGWSKQLLTDAFNTPFEAHIERERVGICSCASHPDGKEGLRAFAEKRRPVFAASRQGATF